MELRMIHNEVNPAAYEAMKSLESFVLQSSLDEAILDLIQLRVSQINGCSFHMNVNGKALYDKGDQFERILLLNVWRDVPNFSKKEKAALELAEHLTKVSKLRVPEQVYKQVREHFNEQQYIDLVMAINVSNCWNRLAIATGMTPGCSLEK
ncbi:carboxymuconolactone decarboxylase family protein [Brevibacillus reuszeri]|uniref:carboxymuconolactone decarboxylase family protein n=1 Tax=Brevibacillus reuszeri TaxID=54915 RepID=UPI003D23AEF2